MRYSLKFSLLALALAAMPGAAAAVTGLSAERAGVGLKLADASHAGGGIGLRVARPEAWQVAASEASDEVAYSRIRDTVRLGARATEYLSGVYFPLSEAWGASLESGVLPGSPLLPRRYSLAGQLHTAFAGGGGLSIGLKYRIYESDMGVRDGVPLDAAGTYGYTLVPLRAPGASPGSSYQVQLSYQYNPANIFGLAYGRELETFTPGFEVPGNGPRLTFTGQHWLTPSWALSYDLLSNDPNSFRLQGLRFGVRYRF